LFSSFFRRLTIQNPWSSRALFIFKTEMVTGKLFKPPLRRTFIHSSFAFDITIFFFAAAAAL
jgi:hypothetical protein